MDTILMFAAAAQAEAENGGGGGNLLIPIMVTFALLWFILIRPQKRDRQQRESMLQTLKKGDRVVTAGGIHGKVQDLDKNSGVVTIEIAPKTPIKVNLTAIASVDSKTPAPAELESQEK